MLPCPFLVLSPTFTISRYLVSFFLIYLWHPAVISTTLPSTVHHLTLSIGLSLVFVSLLCKHWLKTLSHSFIYNVAQMAEDWNLSSWWPLILFCSNVHEKSEFLARLRNLVKQISGIYTLFHASDSVSKHSYLILRPLVLFSSGEMLKSGYVCMFCINVSSILYKISKGKMAFWTIWYNAYLV